MNLRQGDSAPRTYWLYVCPCGEPEQRGCYRWRCAGCGRLVIVDPDEAAASARWNPVLPQRIKVVPA